MLLLISIVNSIEIRTELSIDGFHSETVLENFGFGSGGRLLYEVSFINLTHFNTFFNESWSWQQMNIWLIIVDQNQKKNYYDHISKINVKNANPNLCTAPAYARFEISRYSAASITLSQDGLYSILFLSCSPQTFTSKVGIHLLASNWNSKRQTVQHLPIESVMLPSVYLFACILYFGLLCWWLIACVQRKPFVKRVHLLLGLTLLSKLASEMTQCLKFTRLNSMGMIDWNLEITSSLLSRYSYTLFLFTGFLLSFGWTITKAHLPLRHGIYITVPFLPYFLIITDISLCEIYKSNKKLDEELACSYFQSAENIASPLVLLFIIFFANLNIYELRSSILATHLNSEAAVLYSKLSGYKSFCWCVVLLVVFPVCKLGIRTHLLSWQYSWLSLALEQTVDLVVYIKIGVTFAPFNEQVLTRAFNIE